MTAPTDPATPHGFDAAALESLLADWRASVQARPRALPEHLSPCRIGEGPHRHRCSREHADLVEGYRLARHVDEVELERATLLWPAEVEEYVREHPLVTFGRWLRQLRRPGDRPTTSQPWRMGADGEA